ncbi:cytochrome C [Betaproteobacteria bacterium GR16-43]|nr:cytochrome C [Betaproteobacteria bacterium GR16-43]
MKYKILIAATASILAFGAQAAGDPASGQKKNFQCQGCHGIPGWKTAFPEVYPVPKLGGQHSQYIVSALKAYKSGERDHASMRAIAADMSEKDMEDIAAYYGAVSKAAAPQAAAAKK